MSKKKQMEDFLISRFEEEFKKLKVESQARLMIEGEKIGLQIGGEVEQLMKRPGSIFHGATYEDVLATMKAVESRVNKILLSGTTSPN